MLAHDAILGSEICKSIAHILTIFVIAQCFNPVLQLVLCKHLEGLDAIGMLF